MNHTIEGGLVPHISMMCKSVMKWVWVGNLRKRYVLKNMRKVSFKMKNCGNGLKKILVQKNEINVLGINNFVGYQHLDFCTNKEWTGYNRNEWTYFSVYDDSIFNGCSIFWSSHIPWCNVCYSQKCSDHCQMTLLWLVGCKL